MKETSTSLGVTKGNEDIENTILMKIELLTIGKTEGKYLIEGIDIYTERLKHYINFSLIEIPSVKNYSTLNTASQKEKEGEQILSKVDAADILILLDEQGKEMNSVGFSRFIQNFMNQGRKKIIFVIGGPFGFSDNVYKRADYKLALSQLTFSHQMVRLFFAEQIYRAMTIIKGEKYHHE